MKKVLVMSMLIMNITTYAQKVENDSIKDVTLESVTIVGNKSASIPGSGQYISNIKLEKLNQTNINNVLRIVPGVNVRDEEGFGLRPNIGLRGTPMSRSSKITLMEDGILIAPAPYADPAAYYFPTFARMQGIEILKGSSQIKYGPYTIGGAVNLLSTAIPNSFKGFAELAYGSFNTNQERIWVGDSRKNFDYVIDINRIASNGFKELDNGGNTGFDRRDIMGKFRWHTSQNAKIPQSVTLKFVSSSEDGNETYLGLTYNDYKANPLRRYSATQLDRLDMNHNQLALSHSIAPIEGLDIYTTAYYTKTFRDWGRANTVGGQSLNNILLDPVTNKNPYLIMAGKLDGDIVFQNAERSYFAKGVQSNAQYQFNTGKFSHKIGFGIRYHVDQADRYATSSKFKITNGTMILTAPGVKGDQENQIRNAKSTATYFNYDISFKGLKVSPGVRYENIAFDIQNYGKSDYARLGTNLGSAENKISVFLPGIGANYKLNEKINLLGGIHKGFSPPGMPSLTSKSQARIETSINYELGFRFQNKSLNTQITGFRNDYDNILGSDNISGGGAGTGDMFNAGKAKIEGIEFSLEYDLFQFKKGNSDVRIPLSIAYTYTRARFLETFKNGGGDWGTGQINKGDYIPFITPHVLTTSLGFENKKFNATLVARYTGKTRVKPSQDNIIVPNSDELNYASINALSDFLIIDFSTNYLLNKSITLFGTINNITNSKAIVANLPQGYRPNIPLSFMVGVKSYF